MRWNRNTFDANAAEIVDTLRRRGISVGHVMAAHRDSTGVPDLVCGYRGRTHLLEIKTLGGRLRPSQQAFHNRFHGCVHVATNSLEAWNLILECQTRVAIPERVKE